MFWSREIPRFQVIDSQKKATPAWPDQVAEPQQTMEAG
jgi:hypothetical protein